MESCYIFKIESLSFVDGVGLRFVVFLSGCDFRCGFCHNPEGWSNTYGEKYTSMELAEKIKRYIPYLKNGGVTFSGGEPLKNSKFILEVMHLLEEYNIDFAIETSGNILNKDVVAVLNKVGHIIFDIKGISSKEYVHVTGFDEFDSRMEFLSRISQFNKKIWVRYIVIKGYNDDVEHIKELKKLLHGYTVEKIQLLPFHKLCANKYEDMQLDFRFSHFEAPDDVKIKQLEGLINER